MKVKNENAGVVGSIKGILGGVVLIIISIILLWWNEGNNVKNIKAVKEASDSYVQVDGTKVDAENEGKLIATYGKLTTEEELSDSTFEVKLNTVNLKRTVEMYQYKENSEDDSDGYTTYTYEEVWSEEYIDSSDYQDTTKVNPTTKLFDSVLYTVNDAKVGAFKLTQDQTESLDTTKEYTALTDEIATKNNLYRQGNYYVSYEETPKIGDIRVSFSYNDSSDASVLAVQTGDTFTSFNAESGKKINIVSNGIKTGEEMLTDLENSNNILKWVLRLAGVLLCVAGIATILKPIVALGNYIPVLGNIVSSAVGLISLLVGLALSLVVIAIAWIRFRPLLGIILLAAVVGLIILVKKLAKKKQGNTQTVNTNAAPVDLMGNKEENK